MHQHPQKKHPKTSVILDDEGKCLEDQGINKVAYQVQGQPMKMAGQQNHGAMGRRQDLEIASLSSKMETMAFEFADMLKDGLNCQLSGVFVIFFSDGESTLVDD